VKQGLPDRVRIVDAVDHDWLLPRCSAAVHHGGSGTTVAALRAGRRAPGRRRPPPLRPLRGGLPRGGPAQDPHP
jgi:hypothetical protein